MVKKRLKTITRTRRKRKDFKQVWLLGVLIIIGALYLVIRNAIAPFQHEVVPRPDVKTLPPEIKKEIAYATPSATFSVPVLLYHYVEYVQDKKDAIRQSLNIYPSTFEEQIKTLKDAGYTFMTMKELGQVLDRKREIGKNPVILTFDDGYRDFYTDVFPLLKKYRVKATAYIVPGFIGGSNYMLKNQLEEVAENGLVEIGAHTMQHVYLKNAPFVTAEYQIKTSKKVLEEQLHIPIVSFAYPYGAFDEQAMQLVKDAGFKTAVSTVPGIEVNQENRYFIFRIRPGGRTGETLVNYLTQTIFNPY